MILIMAGTEMSHKGTIELETKRLVLRRFTEEDAQDVYKNWLNDREVTKYLPMKTSASMEICRESLYRWIGNYKNKNYYRWGLTLKNTGELIGELSSRTESEIDRIAQIGCVIWKRFWGNGFATEALGKVIKYLIFDVGYNRVEACHSVNNPASGKVMQKAGMKYEGTLRDGYSCVLGFQDSCIYSILRSEITDKC